MMFHGLSPAVVARRGQTQVNTTALRLSEPKSYFRASTVPTSKTNWTGMLWAKPYVDRNNYSGVLAFEHSGHSDAYVEIISDSDGTTPNVFHASGNFAMGASWTLNLWNCWIVRVTTAGACAAFRGVEFGSSLAKYTGTVDVAGVFDQYTMGSTNFDDDEWYNGAIGLGRCWNAVLSDAEALTEFLSPTPVRTANILGDWRMSSLATMLVDSSGVGNTLTQSATPGTRSEVAGPSFLI